MSDLEVIICKEKLDAGLSLRGQRVKFPYNRMKTTSLKWQQGRLCENKVSKGNYKHLNSPLNIVPEWHI